MVLHGNRRWWHRSEYCSCAFLVCGCIEDDSEVMMGVYIENVFFFFLKKKIAWYLWLKVQNGGFPLSSRFQVVVECMCTFFFFGVLVGLGFEFEKTKYLFLKMIAPETFFCFCQNTLRD